MAEFEVKISREDQQFLDAFQKKFSTVLGRRELLKSLIPEFDRIGLAIAGDISKNELSGQRLDVRTGALRRSILGQAELRNRLPAIVVGVFKGPALAYAAIQEEGGVIKPKRAKTLAMPIGSRALTPAGVSRFDSPRNFPGELTYFPINRAKVVAGLVDEQGEMQYLLLREVVIKGTHYLEAGVEKNLGFVTESIANFLVKKILEV